MAEEIIVYKALDFLFCEPDKPEYEPIIKVLPEYPMPDNIVGYKTTNMINVCNQGSFVTAIQCPNSNQIMLVFGKYPVLKFLLQKVGRVIIKPKK